MDEAREEASTASLERSTAAYSAVSKYEIIQLRYKKWEISIILSSVIVSSLGLLFLLWQLLILNEQTRILNRSVQTQEHANSFVEKRDVFEVKRFLVERFAPKISHSSVEGFKHNRDDNVLAISLDIKNLGSNRLVAAGPFYYDLMRCFNRDFWRGETWLTWNEFAKQETSAEPIDYSKQGIRWVDLFSGSETSISYQIAFPDSAFQSFHIGERIAIEAFFTVFDPDQIEFREEIELIDLTYGGNLSFRGRKISFPAILSTISHVQTLELSERGWVAANPDESCVKVVQDN